MLYGELAGLRDQPVFTASPLELDDGRANVVLGLSEEPHVIDVPRVAGRLLERLIDR